VKLILLVVSGTLLIQTNIFICRYILLSNTSTNFLNY